MASKLLPIYDGEPAIDVLQKLNLSIFEVNKSIRSDFRAKHLQRVSDDGEELQDTTYTHEEVLTTLDDQDINSVKTFKSDIILSPYNAPISWGIAGSIIEVDSVRDLDTGEVLSLRVQVPSEIPDEDILSLTDKLVRVNLVSYGYYEFICRSSSKVSEGVFLIDSEGGVLDNDNVLPAPPVEELVTGEFLQPLSGGEPKDARIRGLVDASEIDEPVTYGQLTDPDKILPNIMTTNTSQEVSGFKEFSTNLRMATGEDDVILGELSSELDLGTPGEIRIPLSTTDFDLLVYAGFLSEPISDPQTLQSELPTDITFDVKDSSGDFVDSFVSSSYYLIEAGVGGAPLAQLVLSDFFLEIGVSLVPSMKLEIKELGDIVRNKIHDLDDGVDPKDAINKGQLDAVDAAAVHKDGDEVINGVKTFSDGILMSGASITGLPDPVDEGDAVPNRYLDNFVGISSVDSISGQKTFLEDIIMSDKSIKGLSTPTDEGDAVSLKYKKEVFHGGALPENQEINLGDNELSIKTEISEIVFRDGLIHYKDDYSDLYEDHTLVSKNFVESFSNQNSIKYTESDTKPTDPKTGDQWVNLVDGIKYTWFNDEVWVKL